MENSKVEENKGLEYFVFIFKDKNGVYTSWVPELNNISDFSEDYDELLELTKEAVSLYLEDLSELPPQQDKDKLIEQFENEVADEINEAGKYFIEILNIYEVPDKE